MTASTFLRPGPACRPSACLPSARLPLSRTLGLSLALVGLGLLPACGTAPTTTAPPPPPEPQEPAPVSTAQAGEVALAAASASLVSGKLAIVPFADGVRLTGEVGGLAPGSAHAIHIHETGDCSAVDASSAGGHFNPAEDPHGRAGHGAHHGGDMDNIHANGDGVARVDVQAIGVTLGGGAYNDIDGRAVIVHAAADDYVSQPTGNAGARLACGVIRIVR